MHCRSPCFVLSFSLFVLRSLTLSLSLYLCICTFCSRCVPDSLYGTICRFPLPNFVTSMVLCPLFAFHQRCGTVDVQSPAFERRRHFDPPRSTLTFLANRYSGPVSTAAILSDLFFFLSFLGPGGFHLLDLSHVTFLFPPSSTFAVDMTSANSSSTKIHPQAYSSIVAKSMRSYKIYRCRALRHISI